MMLQVLRLLGVMDLEEGRSKTLKTPRRVTERMEALS